MTDREPFWPWESAPTPDEAAVERVARAISDNSDPYDPRDWGDYVRDARAALAPQAGQPSDGEAGR